MTETTSINDLPLETFVDILKYLDGCTLGNCRRVCKQWKECIDDSDHVWHEMCQKEFEYSSSLAKRKASSDCQWYHIYRNLKLWSKVMTFEKNLREFYKFSLHDTNHLLNVDNGILPLRDAKGVVLYDLSTLKYIPVAFPEVNCLKIVNSDFVTVIQLKSGILLQRSIESRSSALEHFIKADGFVLGNNMLYFYQNKDVSKVDLANEVISPKLILHCDYNIKEITQDKGVVHLFTDCGKIVTIQKDYSVNVKAINCPMEWLKQIKHIRAVNDKNFVCYSRNLFKIETAKYQHLYLEFLPITALFFYVDIVLIGTGSGEILLYRLSNQKKATRPIFETIGQLPEGKFATQIDVCERQKGPMIIVSTFFELYVLEFDFYSNEQETKKSFTSDKLLMYKRLLKLKERLLNS